LRELLQFSEWFILMLFLNESWIYFSLRFVKEYFTDPDPRRNYGLHVVNVFHKLRAQNFEDPFGPAKEQFGGSGSYGNGAAMRVAPLALFCHSDYNELLNLVRQSAEITHTHKQGYNGAILQVNPQFVFFNISNGAYSCPI
jgi:ADP-ribosylglycohydrolase